MTTDSPIVCRGCWSLGNNCRVCARCKETEADGLRALLVDVLAAADGRGTSSVLAASRWAEARERAERALGVRR